jgi:hypothetical protein
MRSSFVAQGKEDEEDEEDAKKLCGYAGKTTTSLYIMKLEKEPHNASLVVARFIILVSPM